MKSFCQFMCRFGVMSLMLLCLSVASVTRAYAQAYVEMQGGVGGMYTQHYSDHEDPYYKIHLRDGLAYRFSAGYLFDKSPLNYGLEVGYAGYPHNQYEFSFSGLDAAGEQKYQGDYVDLLGVLTYNLQAIVHQNFYVVGKAGVARVMQQFNGESTAFGSTFTFNKTVRQYRWEAALGAGYDVTKTMSVDVSYHHVFAGHANPNADPVSESYSLTQVSSINTVMIGVSYHFL